MRVKQVTGRVWHTARDVSRVPTCWTRAAEPVAGAGDARPAVPLGAPSGTAVERHTSRRIQP